MNFGSATGGSIFQNQFNLDHTFNSPMVLGDGTFIKQGHVGTGTTTQRTMGEAEGGKLDQKASLGISFLNLQAVQ